MVRRRKTSKKEKSPKGKTQDKNTRGDEWSPSKAPSSSFQAFQTDDPFLLSQAAGDAYCEVGWDNYMPSQPSGENGNVPDTEELIQMFGQGSKQGEGRTIPSTPPLLSLWLQSPEGRSHKKATNPREHRFPRRSRRGRPSGIRASMDAQFLQQLTSAINEANQQEQEADGSPELKGTRRSPRINDRKLENISEMPVENKTSTNHHSTESSFDLFESTSRLPVEEPASKSETEKPLPTENLSADDLWTDEELFDNDSFIRATQDLVDGTGLASPNLLKRCYKTSTPDGGVRKMARLCSVPGSTPPGPGTLSRIRASSPLSPLVPTSTLYTQSAKLPYQSYRARTVQQTSQASQQSKEGIIPPSQHTTTTVTKFQFKAPTQRPPQVQRTWIPHKTSSAVTEGIPKPMIQSTEQTCVRPAKQDSAQGQSSTNKVRPMGSGRPTREDGKLSNLQAPGPERGTISNDLQIPYPQGSKNSSAVAEKISAISCSSTNRPRPQTTTITTMPRPLSTSTQASKPCSSPNLNDVSLSDDLLATLAEPDDLLDSQADPQLSPTQTFSQLLEPAMDNEQLQELAKPTIAPGKAPIGDCDDQDDLAEPELLALVEDVELRASQETKPAAAPICTASSQTVPKYSQAEVEQKRLAALKRKQKQVIPVEDSVTIKPLVQKQESVSSGSTILLSQESNSRSPSNYSVEEIERKRQEAMSKRRQKSPRSLSQGSNSNSPIKCTPPEKYAFSKQTVSASGNQKSVPNAVRNLPTTTQQVVVKPMAPVNNNRRSPVMYDQQAIERKRLEALKRRNNKLSLNRK